MHTKRSVSNSNLRLPLHPFAYSRSFFTCPSVYLLPSTRFKRHTSARIRKRRVDDFPSCRPSSSLTPPARLPVFVRTCFCIRVRARFALLDWASKRKAKGERPRLDRSLSPLARSAVSRVGVAATASSLFANANCQQGGSISQASTLSLASLAIVIERLRAAKSNARNSIWDQYGPFWRSRRPEAAGRIWS